MYRVCLVLSMCFLGPAACCQLISSQNSWKWRCRCCHTLHSVVCLPSWSTQGGSLFICACKILSRCKQHQKAIYRLLYSSKALLHCIRYSEDSMLFQTLLYPKGFICTLMYAVNAIFFLQIIRKSVLPLYDIMAAWCLSTVSLYVTGRFRRWREQWGRGSVWRRASGWGERQGKWQHESQGRATQGAEIPYRIQPSISVIVLTWRAQSASTCPLFLCMLTE